MESSTANETSNSFMETSVAIERLSSQDIAMFVSSSHEILRENLKKSSFKKGSKKKFKKFKCKVCREVFPDDISLLNHAETHDQTNPYQCDKCPYKTNNRKYLSRHTLKVHDKSKRKLECPICKKRFHYQCLLDKHSRVHTGEKPNKCEYCGKAFNSRYSLKTHMYMHTNEKPYKCLYCEYTCRDNSTLRKHQNRHLGVVPQYQCDLCARKYEKKCELRQHVEEKHLYMEVDKFKCKLCKRKFKSRCNLTKHVDAVHNRTKTGKCGICDRTLSNSSNLKNHMRTHLDLRPYKCQYEDCNKTFKDHSALTKHAVLHDPDKFFFCEECGKGFSRKSRLVYHIAFHRRKEKWLKRKKKENEMIMRFNKLKKKPLTLNSEGPKFVCDKCGFFTGSKGSLVMHIKYANCTFEGTTCKICKRSYRRRLFLKLHYRHAHNIRYASDIPEVEIKREPIDPIPDMEIDLMEIHKEEPFTGFGNEEMEFDGSLEPKREEFGTENAINTENEGDSSTQGPPERKTMEVGEFLQRVLSEAEKADAVKEEEDCKEYAKQCLEQLMIKSNKKNGLKAEVSRRRTLKRIDASEISNFITNVHSVTYNTEDLIEKAKEPKKKKKKRRKERNRSKSSKSGDGMSKRRNKEKLNKDLDDLKNNSDIIETADEKSEKDEQSLETAETDEQSLESTEKDKDSNSAKNTLKMLFNSHQCYVCFKLFNTKPELIDHCKQHFDVCNETTLKKCPFCPYVTKGYIKRHIKLIHKVDVKFSYMRLRDRKDNSNGSRYFYDLDNMETEKMEVIPSVKILNKKASMDLDKRNRELKNKSILKRKLVKKGEEWVVETEKVDTSDRIIPSFKSNNYLEHLRVLSLDAKKRGEKILYPCNSCEKICLNLSALTLHSRKHNPNKKPYRPKVWKHRSTGESMAKDNFDPVVIENRLAAPKPIVNKHKCDPLLKKFYETNIKGGDIEFWQFLKIYNKIDRENIKDFKELTERNDFGIHDNGNVINETDTNNGNVIKETNVNNGNKVNNLLSNKNNKSGKFVRKIWLSRMEHKRRLEIQKRMRENIQKNKLI